MKRLFFTFLFFIAAGASYADSEYVDSLGHNSLNPSVVDLIFSDYEDSVHHCSKGKVYLKPERIFIEGSSLWVYNGNTSLEIPTLCCDASGYYVASEQVSQLVPWYKCTNPQCGRVWDFASHPSAYCPVCKSPGKFQGI